MTLGQNQQYFYSPDIVAYVQTAANGIVDVSEDIMSFTINRQVNAPSTAQVVLANNNFKYTPGSNSSPPFSKPPVISTMDQIVISLKRETYYQVFTGFVTYAPVVTLIPQPIILDCVCTLYKAQQSYWDSGALDLQNIIPGILFDYSDRTASTTYADGGVGQGIVNLLEKVCNWTGNDIHIGPIPTTWINNANTLYSQMQLDEKLGTNSTTLINLTDANGLVSKQNGYTETGSGSSINAVLSYASAPPGTGIPFTNCTLGVLSMSEIKKDGFGVNLDSLAGVSDQTYWCALPFPWFTSQSTTGNTKSVLKTNTTAAKAWLTGSAGPDAYPNVNGNSYGAGRLIALQNPANGAQVLVHAVYATPGDWPVQNQIIVSEAAFAALTGTPISGKNVSGSSPDNINIQGWVSPSETQVSLTGQVVVPANQVTTGSNQVAASALNYSSNPLQTPLNTTQINALLPQVNGVAEYSKIDAITWCATLLQAIGVPKSNIKVSTSASKCSNNIQALLLWIAIEGDYFLSAPITGNQAPEHSCNDPLNTSLNTSWKFSYRDVVTGIYETAQTILGSCYSKVAQALANPNVTLEQFSTAVGSSPWDGGYVKPNSCEGKSYGGPTAFLNELKSTPLSNYSPQNVAMGNASSASSLIGGTAGVQNFNLNNIQSNYSVAANILEGQPMAFITDQQAITTITTLCTTGLRSFQSAPNGDFLAWFPDYFGLYDTAPAMFVYGIEILDLVIYHDDTQLYTHIGVSGDPTGLGQNGVNLADWLSTSGIVTVQDISILNLLFGLPTSAENAISTYFPNLTGQQWITNFLSRYGMRPYVDEEPMIQSPLVEFMYAVQTFMMLWANQYATTVTLTFMPEIYPGMLLVLPEWNLQVYVMNVVHSGARDSGFTTQVTVTAPTYVEFDSAGSIINRRPVDFGYPWTGAGS
jgi:hypothetical protein